MLSRSTTCPAGGKGHSVGVVTRQKPPQAKEKKSITEPLIEQSLANQFQPLFACTGTEMGKRQNLSAGLENYPRRNITPLQAIYYVLHNMNVCAVW